jgi:HSP20 family molecular chaperone IbpA
MDLFKDPFFIGFNRELDRLNQAHSINAGGFPPYDLLKLDDDNYIITLAVAGFSKESLDIAVDKGTLIIKGEQATVTDANGNASAILQSFDGKLADAGIIASLVTIAQSVSRYSRHSSNWFC